MKFSENLYTLRKNKGISQEQLAELVDVSRQSVSKWELAESYPTVENIFKLCNVVLYILIIIFYNIFGDFMNQEKLNDIIGRNIKKYRTIYNENGKKLTQEKLAEIINVSVSLISNLESSKCKKGISISNLYKISKVLNVPIHKFLEESDEWSIQKRIFK